VKAAVALLAVALAVGLRLWGLGFSRDAPYGRPDEEIFVTRALRYFSADRHTAGAETLESGWPEGFPRTVALIQRLQSRLVGPSVNLGCVYAFNPFFLHLPVRLLSLLAGTLACVVVGRTVARLRGPSAFALGVLALGCNYLAGRDAHFGVTDAMLLLCIALTLHALVRALVDGEPAWLLGAAAAAGAGFGYKYAAAPLLVPCVVAAVGCLRQARERRRTLALALALACPLLALASFALLSSQALVNPTAFWSGLTSHGDRYGGRGWLPFEAYLVIGLPTASGWIGLAGALAGLVSLWRRERWVALTLGGYLLASLGVLARLNLAFARYASPMLPALAMGLGVAFADAWRWSERDVRRRAAAWAFVLAALVPPTVRLVRLDRVLARVDTRDLVLAWLARNAPGEPVEPLGDRFDEIHALPAELAELCAPAVPPSLRRYVPVLPDPPRYTELRPQIALASPTWWWPIAMYGLPPLERVAKPERVRWVVEPESYLRPRADPFEPLPSCFHEVMAISPGENPGMQAFDEPGNFWVPYVEFGGLKRPGPSLRILRNDCR
jgi:hypothetical protein